MVLPKSQKNFHGYPQKANRATKNGFFSGFEKCRQLVARNQRPLIVNAYNVWSIFLATAEKPRTELLVLLCQIIRQLVMLARKRASSAIDGKFKLIPGAWIPAIPAGMTIFEKRGYGIGQSRITNI